MTQFRVNSVNSQEQTLTMASILPGFEYDIFISYRHKDNKYDGWVSEFVANLRKEIEATFKEDISIYFDENPHDGLLENHHVDDSLSSKLKCLVFIPIISQTYCDPKSFAWQHELLAFKNTASEDEFGLKVRLANANVASRILPVKIHDIDETDKHLIENELGGIIRSIDFIFKSAGVNRPLRPKDDELREGENHTVYRNQINKVANAIKEIIGGLKQRHQSHTRDHQDSGHSQREEVKPVKLTTRKNLAFASTGVLLVTICLYIFFSFFGFNKSGTSEHLNKSIAILPFNDLSKDNSQEYFGDGVAEMIRTNLSKVKDLSVTSMRSVIQYRDSKKTIPEIGDELHVQHILEGSILKDGNSVRVIVQLIDAGSDSHIWSETYDRNMDQIFEIQSDIAHQVALMLQLKLTEKEQGLIEAKPETSLAAYDYVLSGQHSLNELWDSNNSDHLDEAIRQFKKALEIDPKSEEATIGLGWSYFYNSTFGRGHKWLDSARNIAEKIIKINKQSPGGYILLGKVSYDNGEKEKSRINLEKALLLDPNNIDVLAWLGYVYKEQRNFKKGIPLSVKAIRLAPATPNNVNYQFNDLGYLLFEAGHFDQAEEAWKKQTVLYPNDYDGYFSLFLLKMLQGKREEAKKIADDHLSPDLHLERIDNINHIDSYAWIYYLAGQYDKALPLLEAMLKRENDGFEESARTHIFRHRLAHILQMKGEVDRSKKIFQEHMQILERTVQQGKTRFGLEYDLANAYLMRGDKEKAYFWLEKLPYDKFLYIFINLDPLFDPIRKEERFQKVLRKFRDEQLLIRNVIEMSEVQSELKLILR